MCDWYRQTCLDPSYDIRDVVERKIGATYVLERLDADDLVQVYLTSLFLAPLRSKCIKSTLFNLVLTTL